MDALDSNVQSSPDPTRYPQRQPWGKSEMRGIGGMGPEYLVLLDHPTYIGRL